MFKLKGNIILQDQDGNELSRHNMVVSSGLGLIRQILAGRLTDPTIAIKFGNGQTPMNASNTSITNPVDAEVTLKDVTEQDFKANFHYHLPFTAGNELGTLREMGLFFNGTMMSRVLFDTPYTKDVDKAYQGVWSLQITAHPDDLVFIVDDDLTSRVVSDDGSDYVVDLLKA